MTHRPSGATRAASSRALAIGILASALALPRTMHAQAPALTPPIDTTQPLGSAMNPILARGPSGEAEFIARLRCADGTKVTVLSRGSSRDGPHGHIIDGYVLRCDALGTTHTLKMDMYHGEGDRERRAVAPFTVLAEHPARLVEGCPPRVFADADSSAQYAFIWWEVEKPARLTNPPQPMRADNSGTVNFEFVVDAAGRIDTGSVRAGRMIGDSTQQRIGREQLATLLFEPAEHRAGCRVRQRSGVSFRFSPR